jgi:hypothetical protein
LIADGRQGARDRIDVFLANLARGSPMYERTSKDTHLETVCYEMDVLEFLLSGVYEKPSQLYKGLF